MEFSSEAIECERPKALMPILMSMGQCTCETGGERSIGKSATRRLACSGDDGIREFCS